MKSFFASAILAATAAATSSDHWAVCVAGSSGFSNYRHQSDAHHCQQLMKKNGIPAENIILMSYDDAANSRQNPFKGQLFNKPNGENVYDASAINYKGNDVTPEKFLAVLTGDEATAQGPVLKSNSKSKVFVAFFDHGAPGLIAFPHKYLYADDLNKAINTMHSNNMYEKLVFYIEACESGSMFPDLKNDIGVYAVTASNAN